MEKEKAAAQTIKKLAEDIDQFGADIKMLKTGISVAEQSIRKVILILERALVKKDITRRYSTSSK